MSNDVPNPMNPYGGRGRDENNSGGSHDGSDDQLEQMLRGLMGGATPDPAMLDALRGMGMGNMDPSSLGMMQAQFQAMMSGDSGDAFNESMAKNVARQVVAAEGDPSIPASTTSDVTQVVHVANLWLDAATDFSAPSAPAAAISRSEWIESTMPTWRSVVEPVATGVGAAIADAMMKQLGSMDSADLSELGIPEGMLPAGFDISSLQSQMAPMLKQMSSTMFGMQVGQALGALAGETLSGTEVGLPLMKPARVAMLPSNIATFAEGLEIDAGEVHLYLAVREAARVRLFEQVPWLGPALIAAVQSYAGDIRIDTEAIEEQLREVDPNDAEAMQEALAGNLFSPEPSEAQQRALAHLETLLALVEGWVDVVTDSAVSAHLPHSDAMSEAVRRRRASGGPAEKVFSSLVGLELRPRRLREAAELWRKLGDSTDTETRDKAWAHPDFAPTADDLGEPDAYIARRSGTEQPEPQRDAVDDELDKLLAQGLAELDAEKTPSAGSPTSGSGDSEGAAAADHSSKSDENGPDETGAQAKDEPAKDEHTKNQHDDNNGTCENDSQE